MSKVNEKLIVAGFGGQGVMLLGQLLSYAATEEDYNTVWIPSYGPETRGGTANCSVIISSDEINSPVVSMCDTLIALNEPSLKKFESKVKPGGTIITNSGLIKDYDYRSDVTVHAIDASQMALEIGNLKTINMVTLGAYIGAKKIFTPDQITAIFKKIFTGSKEKLIDVNKQALKVGLDAIKA